jgi:hypothetical protein
MTEEKKTQIADTIPLAQYGIPENPGQSCNMDPI